MNEAKKYIKMGTKTGKTSHVDRYRFNSILMRKARKEHVTAKVIWLRKLVVMVVKDHQEMANMWKTDNN